MPNSNGLIMRSRALLLALAGVMLVSVPQSQAQTANATDPDSCVFQSVIDLRTGVPTTFERVLGEAASTQLVFLGETRAVPEHVTAAACILEAKAGSRPPVLALEHVPANTQRELDDWRSTMPFDGDRFADRVGWEGLNLPDFNVYRPLIETAGNARAHILATDIPQPGAPGTPLATLLETAPPYGLQTEEIVDAWVPDMIAAHCDLIDEEAARVMALAQMERDQIMAGRLVAGRGRGPSTLFFGDKAHVRMDRAVPYLLARTDRPPSMLTIAAYTEEEWAAVLDQGNVREQGLQARYDVVIVAGNSPTNTDEQCAAMRQLLGQ